MTFAARLRAAVAAHGELCVGIDPHAAILDAWGLAHDAAGAERLGRSVVEASAGAVAVVKPQVALFEAHGSSGLAALERVLADARAAGQITIADAKRGDIGSTNRGYADAWLAAGSPLEADALTVSPYLGVGALDPLLDAAEASGKGVFVLAATSNPEAAALQSVRLDDGRSVARAVAEEVAARNAATGAGHGIVVGATIDRAPLGLVIDPATPVLAPGFGAQGARLEDRRALFPGEALVLASASRSILGEGERGLAGAIARARAELAVSS